jgi:sugar O-acyltransferase (sialic acid O-acetyltransferase NeuD family)
MSKRNLILIGAGGHAKSCIDIIEQDPRFRIAGLVGVVSELNTECLGYSVIATDNELQELAKEYQYAFIALGQIQSPDNRMRLYEQVTRLGFMAPSIIAPSARVSRHSTIGAGSIVMHGAIVNAGARVGDNTIINTLALVEHDTAVGDHCHISTGAILNGNVRIGEGSFIGSGSILKEGISIGKRSIVGMGQHVRHDCADHALVAG